MRQDDDGGYKVLSCFSAYCRAGGSVHRSGFCLASGETGTKGQGGVYLAVQLGGLVQLSVTYSS